MATSETVEQRGGQKMLGTAMNSSVGGVVCVGVRVYERKSFVFYDFSNWVVFVFSTERMVIRVRVF